MADVLQCGLANEVSLAGVNNFQVEFQRSGKIIEKIYTFNMCLVLCLGCFLMPPASLPNRDWIISTNKLQLYRLLMFL